MSVIQSQTAETAVGRAPSRGAAAADILLTLAAAGVLYALELGLQSLGVLPDSGMYTGAITLVGHAQLRSARLLFRRCHQQEEPASVPLVIRMGQEGRDGLLCLQAA